MGEVGGGGIGGDLDASVAAAARAPKRIEQTAEWFVDRREPERDPSASAEVGSQLRRGVALPSRFDGRVWRVAPDTIRSISTGALNLEKLSGEELIALLSHPNDWYARQARRILAERRDTSLLPALDPSDV